jgi:hypothetical protein
MTVSQGPKIKKMATIGGRLPDHPNPRHKITPMRIILIVDCGIQFL